MSQEKNVTPEDQSLLRQTFYNHDDELDLLDIIAQLWSGKKIIISAVVIMIILAVIYLFTAKEKWTSEAILTQPSAGQVANYNAALNVLYSQYPQDKLAIADLQRQLFSRFSASISALSGELQNQEEPLNLVAEPVTVGRDDPLSIRFSAVSAKEAQTMLTHYIKRVNDDVVDDYGADIKRNLSVKARELAESLAAQERVAADKKQKRIDVIKQAVKVAQDSNITESPLRQAEFLSDDTLYLLGAKALQAMITNEATKPLVLDDNYYNTQRALFLINNLKIQVDNLQSFRYIMQPDLPFRRDSPKRALTLILSVMLGGIIGSGIVLGRNMTQTYRQRKQMS
ncbi:chain length-determining protein [[Pantoea] beijingensis]|uniref:Chain length determinant protein n=1 Tax=[Pantoea] beijingensis TaxID=1324864 RepID=A0A443IAU1_9GAMM|nr:MULTISPECIES: LPS O-antigen chain length determinant protein WzzB [Erwiniaceae]RWR01204.1 chain length-determining protein [[Pantoea] beijingensis]